MKRPTKKNLVNKLHQARKELDLKIKKAILVVLALYPGIDDYKIYEFLTFSPFHISVLLRELKRDGLIKEL